MTAHTPTSKGHESAADIEPDDLDAVADRLDAALDRIEQSLETPKGSGSGTGPRTAELAERLDGLIDRLKDALT